MATDDTLNTAEFEALLREIDKLPPPERPPLDDFWACYYYVAIEKAIAEIFNEKLPDRP